MNKSQFTPDQLGRINGMSQDVYLHECLEALNDAGMLDNDHSVYRRLHSDLLETMGSDLDALGVERPDNDEELPQAASKFLDSLT